MADILGETLKDAKALAGELSPKAVKNAVLETVGLGKNFERKLTPAQEKYEEARKELFSIYRGGPNPERLANALVARKEELEHAIETSELKSAADRNGNSLGNLLELTNLAIKQASGEIAGEKSTLKRTVSTMAREEDLRIHERAEEMTYEGLGTTFPDNHARQIAQTGAENLISDFENGRQQVEKLVEQIK